MQIQNVTIKSENDCQMPTSNDLKMTLSNNVCDMCDMCDMANGRNCLHAYQRPVCDVVLHSNWQSLKRKWHCITDYKYTTLTTSAVAAMHHQYCVTRPNRQQQCCPKKPAMPKKNEKTRQAVLLLPSCSTTLANRPALHCEENNAMKMQQKCNKNAKIR